MAGAANLEERLREHVNSLSNDEAALWEPRSHVFHNELVYSALKVFVFFFFVFCFFGHTTALRMC